MRYALALFAAFLLTACAVPSGDAPVRAPGTKNQPHLPPPDFTSTPVSSNARSCGGMIAGDGPACATGEFCRRTIGDLCGAADAPGICTPIPNICTREYRPVCGCDGQTYSTECVANSNGISASYDGDCKS